MPEDVLPFFHRFFCGANHLPKRLVELDDNRDRRLLLTGEGDEHMDDTGAVVREGGNGDLVT